MVTGEKFVGVGVLSSFLVSISVKFMFGGKSCISQEYLIAYLSSGIDDLFLQVRNLVVVYKNSLWSLHFQNHKTRIPVQRFL